MNPQNIAVFDFDETIISRDSLTGYFRYMAGQSPIRRYAAAIIRMLKKSFNASYAWRKCFCSLHLWVGTVGLDTESLYTHTAKFVDEFLSIPGGARLYPQAVERLKWHALQGHQVVILSASIDRYIKLFMSRIVSDIDCLIIGSTETWAFGGTIMKDYCSGQEKIPLAYKAGLPKDQWGYAYSDHARDLPMLKHAQNRFLINPDEKSIDEAKKIFHNDFEILHWGKKTADSHTS